MAPLTTERDADFYNLIHQLAGSLDQEKNTERRGEQRQPFQAVQRIALRRGPGVPDEPEFVDAQCHDLTCNGFSFLLPNTPNFDSLVVAFGTPSDAIYVAAEVSHCHDVLVYPTGKIEQVADCPGQAIRQDLDVQTATPMVMVGCRFTGRLVK